MKTLLPIALVLFSCTFYGQDSLCRIRGRVMSSAKPVPFSAIAVKGTNTGTLSDANGEFTIGISQPGTFILVVSAVGYSAYETKLELKRGFVNNITIELKEIHTNLGEIVVTGTMKETYSTLSPVKVEVYTPALFKKNPTPNLFEAMSMVNGVQPQINCNVCSTGDIHINGMEGPYTMITIDGMPIVSGLSTVYGLSGIPNSLVQQVEVIKGPASTLYGSEAVAGLVNVITKCPATVPLVSVDLMSSSQKELNSDLSFRFKFKKVSTLVGVNYFNFQNKLDVNNDNFTDITQQNRFSIFNKWSFDRVDGKMSTVAARFVYEDRWGGDMNWNKNFRGGDSLYGESIYTKRYEIFGVYQIPKMRDNIFIRYSFSSHDQNSAYGKILYNAIQNIAFTQVSWNKTLFGKHDILVGLPFRFSYYDDNTIATQQYSNNIVLNTPQKIFLPGLFIQDEYAVHKKVILLPGIRYDYNSDHGNIFSPRLSIKYAPNQLNAIRISAGNGYRVVNLFTEDHAALTGAREVVIKNKLKPEQSWNFNFNYQRFINLEKGIVGFDAGCFFTWFTNKIVGDYTLDPDKIIYDNLSGHAISKGINANIDFSFLSGIKILFGATLMEVYSVQADSMGIDRTNKQLHAPGFSGTFAITIPIVKYGLSIDYTGRVTGPMELPVVPNDFRPSRSPWFSIQNIQLTKRFKNNIELYLGAKNILNFIPKDPLLRPFDPFDKRISIDNPFGYTFDTTYNYAPLQGIRCFIGVRWNFNK